MTNKQLVSSLKMMNECHISKQKMIKNRTCRNSIQIHLNWLTNHLVWDILLRASSFPCRKVSACIKSIASKVIRVWWMCKGSNFHQTLRCNGIDWKQRFLLFSEANGHNHGKHLCLIRNVHLNNQTEWTSL